MSVVLSLLVWLLMAGFLVLLVVLVMPVRIELTMNKAEDWHFAGAWRPLGRLGPRVNLSGGQASTRPKKQTAPKKSAQTRRRLNVNPRRVVLAAIRLVSDIVQSVRIDAANLDVRFGTGDPAETGEIFGMMTPAIYGLTGGRRMLLHVEPVFDRAVLTGHAEVNLSFVPAKILAPAARFGWSAFGPKR